MQKCIIGIDFSQHCLYDKHISDHFKILCVLDMEIIFNKKNQCLLETFEINKNTRF